MESGSFSNKNKQEEMVLGFKGLNVSNSKGKLDGKDESDLK